MKLLYVQLALGLFQLDHAVKQEIEQLPEQEEEHLLPGGAGRGLSDYIIMEQPEDMPGDTWTRSSAGAAV